MFRAGVIAVALCSAIACFVGVEAFAMFEYLIFISSEVVSVAFLVEMVIVLSPSLSVTTSPNAPVL